MRPKWVEMRALPDALTAARRSRMVCASFATPIRGRANSFKRLLIWSEKSVSLRAEKDVQYVQWFLLSTTLVRLG